MGLALSLATIETCNSFTLPFAKVNVAQYGAFRDVDNLTEPRQQLDGSAQ